MKHHPTDKFIQYFLFSFLIVLLAFSIIQMINPHFLWGHFEIINYPVHSTIEAVGALSALLMAFILMQSFMKNNPLTYTFLSLGFLSMGMLDLFHSITQNSDTFVFSHSLALLFGGLFFALINFKWKNNLITRYKYLITAVVVIILAFIIFTQFFPQFIPIMIFEDQFTPLAKWINGIAGILFLLSCIQLFKNYYHYKDLGELILIFVAALSGIVGITFQYSQAWTDSWWLWHILRLIAFLAALLYLLLSFRDVIKERNTALHHLDKKNQQFLALLDGIEDIIYVADPQNYELLYINDVAEKLFGENILGKKCYHVLQGLQAPCSFCTNDIILNKKSGEAYFWEFQNQTTKKWFRCADKAIEWIDGRMVRFEIASDITAIKKIEEHLVKTNKDLETFNTMAVGRELQMISLKKEINALNAKLGKKEPYDLSFTEKDKV